MKIIRSCEIAGCKYNEFGYCKDRENDECRYRYKFPCYKCQMEFRSLDGKPFDRELITRTVAKVAAINGLTVSGTFEGVDNI